MGLLNTLRNLWIWMRFGEITSKVVYRIDYIECEIEYHDRNGKLIGYWAYGDFDPELPYQGYGSVGMLVIKAIF